MGEGYHVLKVHNQVMTGAKSLNLLSTSWNCSKEFEVVPRSLTCSPNYLIPGNIQQFDTSNKEDDFKTKMFVFEIRNSVQKSWIPDSGWT